MSNNGFILLWRKCEETSFFKDSYAFHVACYLLMKANHEEKTIVFNKQNLTIPRGSCVVGRHSIAMATGISASTVWRKLQLLQNVDFLSIKTNNRFTMVTILNYDSYQNTKRKVDSKVNNGWTTDGQRMDTNNTLNTLRNTKEEAVAPAPDFLAALRTNPAYNHINLDFELGKMDAWLAVNPGRQKTKRFIVNWLNKIEKPLGPQKAKYIQKL